MDILLGLSHICNLKLQAELHPLQLICVLFQRTDVKWTQVASGTSFSVKAGQSLWIGLVNNVTWTMDGITMNNNNYNTVPGLTLKYKDHGLCGGWWYVTTTRTHVIANTAAYILLIDDDISS